MRRIAVSFILLFLFTACNEYVVIDDSYGLDSQHVTPIEENAEGAIEKQEALNIVQNTLDINFPEDTEIHYFKYDNLNDFALELSSKCYYAQIDRKGRIVDFRNVSGYNQGKLSTKEYMAIAEDIIKSINTEKNKLTDIKFENPMDRKEINPAYHFSCNIIRNDTVSDDETVDLYLDSGGNIISLRIFYNDDMK